MVGVCLPILLSSIADYLLFSGTKKAPVNVLSFDIKVILGIKIPPRRSGAVKDTDNQYAIFQ